MIREGLLINAPKLIIGAVLVVPTIKFNKGISINAPPPPLMVEIEKESAPAKNRMRTSEKSIFENISATFFYLT